MPVQQSCTIIGGPAGGTEQGMEFCRRVAVGVSCHNMRIEEKFLDLGLQKKEKKINFDLIFAFA